MRCHPVFLIALVVPAPGMAQQGPDPEFKPKVQRRAYVGPGPIVAIDEAHGNFHTMNGRYRPLADLLEADGYQVRANEAAFSAERLRGVQVLIVSNAAATSANVDSSEADASGPAFTSAESDALRDWVRGGGSMLLIADHAPFGSAAAILGERFGIHMGTGFVADPAHSETRPTFLVFSAENGLLGDHPITRGREARENVKRVVTFTGQSLSGPSGAGVLLRLGDAAVEAPNRAALGKWTSATAEAERAGFATPAGGRAQGLAFTFGKGRVVVLGEAAVFSAQVVHVEEGGTQRTFRMGMNVPGNDDQQFALNVVHWLSDLLPPR